MAIREAGTDRLHLRWTPRRRHTPGSGIADRASEKRSIPCERLTDGSPEPTAAGKPVHVSLLEGDGGVYGIGMPVIAYFDRKVTNATAFNQATEVTVNGQPARGAWYWEKSGREGQALEAHYRLPTMTSRDVAASGVAPATGRTERTT